MSAHVAVSFVGLPEVPQSGKRHADTVSHLFFSSPCSLLSLTQLLIVTGVCQGLTWGQALGAGARFVTLTLNPSRGPVRTRTLRSRKASVMCVSRRLLGSGQGSKGRACEQDTNLET